MAVQKSELEKIVGQGNVLDDETGCIVGFAVTEKDDCISGVL